jgi:hypothetical protein
MNFTDTITTAKTSVLQELRRKRKWQTYLVACGLTLCFFLVIGNVLGESSQEPEEVAKVESTEKAEPFRLSDNRSKENSTWELSTGAEASPPQSGPSMTEPVATGPAKSVESKSPKSGNLVVEIAAAQAESRATQKAPLNDLEVASEVTTAFYSALNDGNVGQAYDKLAPEFQAELPYQNFQCGYAAVESISCEIKNSEQISPVQIRLDLQIDAYEAGEDTSYYATCILWKTDDEWSIAGVAQLSAL